MQIEYSRQAVKAIRELDRATKKRIKAGIENLPAGDVKKLQGSKKSFRLRIGDWRVIFSFVAKDMILIEKIGERGSIYKRGV